MHRFFRDFEDRLVARRLRRYDASAEKQDRIRRSCLNYTAAAVRVWQWGSSLFIYLSFASLFHFISHHRLGETPRMKVVQHLGLVTLVYTSTVVACMLCFRRLKMSGWQFFAITTIPTDLLMMGVSIAKITILSIAGLPSNCHGLTRQNYIETDLVRQPMQGYSTVRFGPGNDEEQPGELDYLCRLPKGVYVLSVIAIFSYTLSILLTVLQLQRYFLQSLMNETQMSRSGHVEETIPTFVPRGASISSPAPLHQIVPQPSNRIRTPVPPTPYCPAGPSNPTPANIRVHPDEDQTKYANMPPEVFPSARPRLSEETTASFNPDLYLISDGFREPVDPPAYTSRPSSFYGDTLIEQSPN